MESFDIEETDFSSNDFAAEDELVDDIPERMSNLEAMWRTLVVALPITALQLSGYLTITTDVIFMGHIPNAVTAASAMGLAGAYQAVVGFIAYSPSTQGQFTVVSQAHGRQDVELKARAVLAALLSGTVLACGPVLVLLVLAGPLMRLFPLEEEVVRLVQISCYYAIPGVVLETLYRVVEAHLMNQQVMAPLVMTQAVSLVLNVMLNMLFVLHLHLGFTGSCMSTLMVRILRLFILYIIVRCRSQWSAAAAVCIPRSRDAWKAVLHTVPLVLRAGLAAGVAIWLEVLGFEGLSLLTSFISPSAVAVHVVVFQVLVVSFFLIFGLSNAMNVLVGNSLGAHRLSLALLFARLGGFLVFLSSLLIGALVLLLRSPLANLFSSSDVVSQWAVRIMPLVVVIHIPDALNQIFGALLRATDRAIGSSISSLVSLFCVTAPLCYLFAFHLGLSLDGLWMALAVGTWVSAAISAFFVYRIDWEKAMHEASSSKDIH